MVAVLGLFLGPRDQSVSLPPSIKEQVMNNIIQLNSNNTETMSSRDIADLVNSRHSDVMSSIGLLIEKGVISGYAPEPYTHPQNGQTYKEYKISERDSYIVVAQFSPEFTAALVDHWQKTKNPNHETFVVPQTMSEALQLAADQAKKIERDAPKVAFVENLVERNVLMTATQVAQKHKMSAIKLNKMLMEFGGVYSANVKRAKVFTQRWIEQGYGEMKQTEMGHSQALFTPAGEVRICEILVSEGVIGGDV